MIPGWLKRNFKIKFGLFILAAVLWFLVVTEQTFDYTIDVPIEITGVKSDKVIANDPPRTAAVKFHATGKALLRLRFLDDPYLHVDLSTINYFYTFKPRVDMIVIPGGLEAVPLNIVFPDSIPIVLGERMETKLPVKPNITVKTAPGFVFNGEYEITPTLINLIGPRGELVKIDSVLTVTATPLKVKNNPRGREVIVDPVSVQIQLSGGVSKLTKISSDDIKAWVDFRDLDMTRGGKAPVKCDEIDALQVIEINPDEVRLIVRRK